MALSYLVRVGAMGNVGRFCTPDGALYPRASRVIVRTARGLETGEVLAQDGQCAPREADGLLLRRMTVEDELLAARQAKNRDAALAACQRRLASAGLDVVLMDVELLFDGQNLIFYFLGATSPELDAIVGELTELYEANVQFRQFTESVVQGCGPGCGTPEATGAGCGACSTGCALGQACATGRHHSPVATPDG